MTRLLFALASSHNSVQFLAWRRGRVFNAFLVSISIEVRMIAALGLAPARSPQIIGVLSSSI